MNRYKIIFAALSATYIAMVTTVALLPAANQAPFDFDLFLSELEGALAKIEAEEKEKVETPLPNQSPTQEPSNQILGSTSSSGPVTNQPSGEKRDPRSLFLDPAVVQDTSKDSKKRAEPTKDSLAAYNTIMNEFTDHLSSIKTKITRIPRFSPSFKEEFVTSYQHMIDAIIIANQQIKSKKAYLQLFLAPPEASKQLVDDMKKLRKMILDTATKIKKLDATLSISTEEEETESFESLLRKLAGQYQDTDLQPIIPLQKTLLKERKISQQKEVPTTAPAETKKE